MEKEDKKKDSKPNYVDFFITFLKVLIFWFLMFIFGSWCYYFCKLSQINILPNDPDCYPYTENKPDITYKEVNINVFGEKSEKISASDSQHNTILSFLRKIFDSERTQQGFVMFFINILKQFFVFNTQMIQNICSTINSMFSESIILFLSPILLGFIIPVLLLVDCVYFVYLWFSNLPWIFKKNLNKDKDEFAKWHDITMGEPMSYGLSIFIAFCLIILMIVLCVIPIPIISSAALSILFVVLLTGLFAVCKKVNETEKGSEKYTYLNSLSDNFKYHMRTIMIIITVFLIISVSSNFGALYGGVVFLTSLLLYFKVIPIPIYSLTVPVNLTPLSDYHVADKKCPLPEATAEIKAASLTGGFTNTIKHINKLVKKP